MKSVDLFVVCKQLQTGPSFGMFYKHGKNVTHLLGKLKEQCYNIVT